MTKTKFKIACRHGDREIPGYLVRIHGISMVIHSWHPNYDDEGSHKDAKFWVVSEYHSGRTVLSGEYNERRADVIDRAKTTIGIRIKDLGKKKVLEHIAQCPQIN